MHSNHHEQETPAGFRLLSPARRLVIGLTAAASVLSAGYYVFVPMSDDRAWAMSRRNDAGSSGYVVDTVRLARARPHDRPAAPDASLVNAIGAAAPVEVTAATDASI